MIQVKLVLVHRDMHGGVTYELRFVDDDDNCGSELLVLPTGEMQIAGLDDDEEEGVSER